MFPVHYTYAVASKMLQRRGSSFRNGSESGGKPFWTVREEGKLAKLTSKKQNKTKNKKTKIKTNKQKGFKSLGRLLHFALMQKMRLLIQNVF